MRTTLGLVATILVLVACSGGLPVEVTPTYDRETLEMKYQVVADLIQDTACTDTPDCASVGVGSKPCGGPWRYDVYSTVTVDEDALTTAVADLDAYERGYNQQKGIMSDCALARAAQPACVDQKCADTNAGP